MPENHIGDAHDQLENRSDNMRLRELAGQLAGQDRESDNTRPYAILLHQLASAYGRMPSHIANTTKASYDLLQRYGIAITVLELLEDMARIHLQHHLNRNYAYSQVLCMYVFMRNEGKTRDTACAELIQQLARSGRGFH